MLFAHFRRALCAITHRAKGGNLSEEWREGHKNRGLMDGRRLDGQPPVVKATQPNGGGVNNVDVKDNGPFESSETARIRAKNSPKSRAQLGL